MSGYTKKILVDEKISDVERDGNEKSFVAHNKRRKSLEGDE